MSHDSLTRRITLPSGRVIEIRTGATDPSGATRRETPRKLHVCPACSSELVYPIRWEERPEGFAVLLRCPECERHEEGVFDDDTLVRFDAVLDDATEALLMDYEAVSLANFADDVDRFVAALHGGHVLPEDF
jgi:hypothetical protein